MIFDSIRTTEYVSKCMDIYFNGGSLFYIKRLDTNEVLSVNDEMYQSNKPTPSPIIWYREPSFLIYSFLTKEDAISELPKLNPYLRTGGCHCCGTGSTELEIEIVEIECEPRR